MEIINKEELINYFLTDNKSGYKTKENHVRKIFDGLIEKINEHNLIYFKVELPFTQKLYNYIYNITEIPKCDNCNKLIKWRGIFTEGYLKNCSNECKDKSKLRIERTKTTNLKKYGVDSVLKYEKFKNKRWNTMNEKIIKKFNSLGYEIIESNKNKLKIKHPDGHVFEDDRKLLNNRLNGGFEISTKLLPLKSTHSTYELEIQNFLKELNVIFIIGDKNLLKRKEIDIYLPNYNFAIEFDGLFWHSNIYISNNYHLYKTEECQKQGIQLIHIFEDEWILKKEIVKSIIKSKLNIIDNKIYARKCEIKEINNKICSEFLENNHIQGNINCKIKIGLYYDNELISIMTFGKKRLALGNKTQNNNEYEMLRFCNKLNTQIIGGASKMLKYFIKTYNPKSIITFADRRYSQGMLYKKLGFHFINNTKPNYWYVLKNEVTREHRFNYRKNVLIKEGFDASKTEHEIMAEQGYLRIYDCGSMKFEMNLA